MFGELILEFVTATITGQQLSSQLGGFAVCDRLLLQKKPQQKSKAAACGHLSGQGLSGRLSEATLWDPSTLGESAAASGAREFPGRQPVLALNKRPKQMFW